jgi:AcrR family transcriptional regulator
MSTTETTTQPRAMRADAKRNYDNLLTAAREEFAANGATTSLEKIAKRAGVGIGTLYRNFPTRQDLLEAVYQDEVDQVCVSARELAGEEPWLAFETWTARLVGYLATKQALAAQLLEYMGKDSEMFTCCRTSLFEAGEPLVTRAQDAGALRTDTDLKEIIHLVGGIAKIQGLDEAQRDHILQITLDGLRARG